MALVLELVSKNIVFVFLYIRNVTHANFQQESSFLLNISGVHKGRIYFIHASYALEKKLSSLKLTLVVILTYNKLMSKIL